MLPGRPDHSMPDNVTGLRNVNALLRTVSGNTGPPAGPADEGLSQHRGADGGRRDMTCPHRRCSDGPGLAAEAIARRNRTESEQPSKGMDLVGAQDLSKVGPDQDYGPLGFRQYGACPAQEFATTTRTVFRVGPFVCARPMTRRHARRGPHVDVGPCDQVHLECLPGHRARPLPLGHDMADQHPAEFLTPVRHWTHRPG